MSKATIRTATIADTAQIFKFITELAVYEKAEHEVKANEAQIKESLFGKKSVSQALVCEMNGITVGFAVYFYSYSTWLGSNGIYLEDLYVSPHARGAGAGKALMRHIAQVVAKQGSGRFEWSVLDWNEPSIQFYKSIGAEPQDEWIRYRLEGQALRDFAGL